MTRYTKLKIILSLIIGVMLGGLVYTYLKSLSAEEVVVVATKEIGERERITLDMIKEIKVRKKERELLASNTATRVLDVEGSISKVKIPEGRPINMEHDILKDSETNTTNDGEGGINNAYFVPENMRLLTVNVDSSGAMDNKLRGGDYVDVIATFPEIEDVPGFSTSVMQNIKIYEVRKIEDKDKKSKGIEQNVTLILTPQQSVQLAYAKRNGKIDLALNSSEANNTYLNAVNHQSFIRN